MGTRGPRPTPPGMATTPPPHSPLPFEYAPPPATRRRMRLRKTRLAIAVLVWLALGLVSLFYGFTGFRIEHVQPTGKPPESSPDIGSTESQQLEGGPA